MPAVYQLLGFPGTGKYTVAKAMVALLEARGEPAALLDNHATANLVWSLVPIEHRFDPAVMGHILKVRIALMDAVREITGPAHSIVFTNFLPAGQAGDLLDPHRRVAEDLGKTFVGVVLHCDRAEVLARVPNADRAARYKLVDPAHAATIMDTGQTLPNWDDLIDLDITGLSPEEAAARVLALADDAH
jgi:hypothetical protein